MSDLRIDYGKTDTLGTSVVNKGDEFQTLLNKIKSTNNELKAYWEGTDASKYTSAVEEQAEYMQKLSDTIDEIGAFLRKVAVAYAEASQANADSIN